MSESEKKCPRARTPRSGCVHELVADFYLRILTTNRSV